VAAAVAAAVDAACFSRGVVALTRADAATYGLLGRGKGLISAGLSFDRILLVKNI